MSNYFIKTVLAFIIAILIYFSINSTLLIRDERVLTAVITFAGLLCLIVYMYYNSNFNQFGNE